MSEPLKVYGEPLGAIPDDYICPACGSEYPGLEVRIDVVYFERWGDYQVTGTADDLEPLDRKCCKVTCEECATHFEVTPELRERLMLSAEGK